MLKVKKIIAIAIAGFLFSLDIFAGAFLFDSGEKSLPKEESFTESESVKPDIDSRIIQVKELLEEKGKELRLKREEYVEARNELKEAARTGFLGFGRSNEEIEALLRAKDSMNKVTREYTLIRRSKRRLQTELRQLEREKSLRDRRE